MKEYERMDNIGKLENHSTTRCQDDDVIEQGETLGKERNKIINKCCLLDRGENNVGISSLDEHRIEFDELEGAERDIFPRTKQGRNGGPSNFLVSSLENFPTSSYSNIVARQIKRRVTVHMQSRHGNVVKSDQFGKLMLLPNSIEELCKIAGMIS